MISSNFPHKYIDKLYEGLKQTQYSVSGSKIDVNGFFKELLKITKEVKKNNGRLFFFGNGASASFSNHMALDWSKNGGILALSLSDSSMLTALANDYDYETCFLEYLKINKPTVKDFIITTSSSGNSPNVIKLLKYCKSKNIPSLALSGLNKNNKSIGLCDYSIHVNMKTYGMVECIHQIFHHLWLDNYMGIEEWKKTESQNMDVNNFRL